MSAGAISLSWSPPLDTYAAKLNALRSTGRFESIGKVAEDIEQIILPVLQEHAPKRTGAYAAAIRSTRQVAGSGQRLTFYGPSPLSTFITEGTKAHVIEPRNPGGVLRFEVAGGVVFTRRVNHPGTQPNPFPLRAWDNVRAQVQDRMQTGLRDLAQELRP